jgi:predicted aspartyl protease
MNRLLSGALATVLAAAAACVLSPVVSSQQLDRFNGCVVARTSKQRLFAGAGDPGPRIDAAGAGAGCGTSRIGEITVATLQNAPIVILLANGKPVTLLLDTGAASTILTPAAAQRIGAQPPRIKFERPVGGFGGGTLRTNEVELRSFSAGGVVIPWRRVLVASVNTPSIFLGPLDGVLGADVLSSFDVDLDLPHHRILFYKRQSCPSAAPAWTEPYATIAAGRSRSDHLFFPVRLDGRRIDALFDSGAQLSVLSASAARAFGVTDAALAHDRSITMRGVAGEQASSHIHRFSQLEIGGEVVRAPEFVVTNVKLGDADLVLGINFLMSRRIWLSYGSQQIFLSRRT